MNFILELCFFLTYLTAGYFIMISIFDYFDIICYYLILRVYKI